MNRKELIKAASRMCSKKHYWLKATNDSLHAFLNGMAGCPCCELEAGHGQNEQKGGDIDLADVIAQAIHGKVAAGIDRQEVESIVEKMLESKLSKIPARRLEIVTTKSVVQLEGAQHPMYETILAYCAARENVYMVGGAGTGKTTLAENVAHALQLPFYAQSVGMQTSRSDFFGYIDAHGALVRTTFRYAYENGGVYLIDEIDSGNSNVLTSINAATANSVCGFPDGMIKKHPDFICLAAANTYGNGQDRIFVGRNQLDGATLDRFLVVNIDVDEAFERQIALAHNPQAGDWIDKVQALRRAANKIKARHIISPRASIKGAKLLAAGRGKAELEEAIIWKGCPADTRQEIERNV